MSGFFKAKTKDLGERGEGLFISKSGFKEVILKAVIVDTSARGAVQLNYYVGSPEDDKVTQVLYSNTTIVNTDKTANEIGQDLLSKICLLADVEELDDPTEVSLPIGAKKAPKNVKVFTEIDDVPMVMKVTLEYKKYNGKITNRYKVDSVFQTGTNLSVNEILQEKDTPEDYTRLQKYADEVVYENITKDEVEAWIASGRKNATGGKVPTQGSETPKRPKFGQKVDNKAE